MRALQGRMETQLRPLVEALARIKDAPAPDFGPLQVAFAILSCAPSPSPATYSRICNTSCSRQINCIHSTHTEGYEGPGMPCCLSGCLVGGLLDFQQDEVHRQSQSWAHNRAAAEQRRGGRGGAGGSGGIGAQYNRGSATALYGIDEEVSIL